MQITIIGAGNMARGTPTRALAGGHTVRIIDRAPDKAARLAAGLQETPQPPTSRRPTWRPGIGRGWIMPLPMRASPALCFPCYEGRPGTHGPPGASRERADRISREQRWLSCQFPAGSR
jgi:hypothetical protein